MSLLEKLNPVFTDPTNQVFIVIMSILALIDGITYYTNYHKDLKGIIGSLGIFGTFVGIFFGLLDFNTDDISGSIPPLLNGLKTAFFTSIIGMVLSILLDIIQAMNKKPNVDDLKVAKLNDLTDGMTTFIDQFREFRVEQSLNQKKNYELFEEQFSKLSQDLGGKMGSFSEDLSSGLSQEIFKALGEIIADFNQNLTDQFGDNFKKLNQSVDNMIQWQENYKEIVVKMEDSLKTLMDKFEGLGEIAVGGAMGGGTGNATDENSEELGALLKDIANVIGAYEAQIKELSRYLFKMMQVLSMSMK